MKDYLYRTSSDEDHNLISKVIATLDGGPKKKLSLDLQRLDYLPINSLL